MGKLIVGLGNPGREYEETRHNIGFMLIDQLPFAKDAFWKEKYKGLYAKAIVDGEEVHLLKPLTYMNLSGESVQKVASFFKVEPKDIIVLHDELDIPFGTIVMKFGGGLAGHNGLKSIAQCLGTKDFARLRMGIGRPSRGSVSDFVLSKFTNEEFDWLGQYFEGSIDAVDSFIAKGFESSSKKFGRKKIVEEIK